MKKMIITMSIITILLILFILVLLVLAIPWLVFWSVKQLFNFEIMFNWKTILAFWILYFIFKGSFSFEKKETIKMGNITTGTRKGLRW